MKLALPTITAISLLVFAMLGCGNNNKSSSSDTKLEYRGPDHASAIASQDISESLLEFERLEASFSGRDGFLGYARVDTPDGPDEVELSRANASGEAGYIEGNAKISQFLSASSEELSAGPIKNLVYSSEYFNNASWEDIDEARDLSSMSREARDNYHRTKQIIMIALLSEELRAGEEFSFNEGDTELRASLHGIADGIELDLQLEGDDSFSGVLRFAYVNSAETVDQDSFLNGFGLRRTERYDYEYEELLELRGVYKGDDSRYYLVHRGEGEFVKAWAIAGTDPFSLGERYYISRDGNDTMVVRRSGDPGVGLTKMSDRDTESSDSAIRWLYELSNRLLKFEADTGVMIQVEEIKNCENPGPGFTALLDRVNDFRLLARRIEDPVMKFSCDSRAEITVKNDWRYFGPYAVASDIEKLRDERLRDNLKEIPEEERSSVIGVYQDKDGNIYHVNNTHYSARIEPLVHNRNSSRMHEVYKNALEELVVEYDDNYNSYRSVLTRLQPGDTSLITPLARTLAEISAHLRLWSSEMRLPASITLPNRCSFDFEPHRSVFQSFRRLRDHILAGDFSDITVSCTTDSFTISVDHETDFRKSLRIETIEDIEAAL